MSASRDRWRRGPGGGERPILDHGAVLWASSYSVLANLRQGLMCRVAEEELHGRA